MRIFLAVLFDAYVKQALMREMEALKKCARADFTKPQNLHMTLAFIGETDRTGEIVDIVKEIHVPATTFHINGVDCFERGGERLYYTTAQVEPAFLEMRRALIESLLKAGIPFDGKRFTPHITIARRARLFGDYRCSIDVSQRVSAINVMNSVRINGSLNYEVLA